MNIFGEGIDEIEIGGVEMPLIKIEDLGIMLAQDNGHTIDPYRPFIGQPHTDQGERGKTEVQGLRIRDLCDCVAMAFVDSAAFDMPGDTEEYLRNGVERKTLSYHDLYKLDLSKMDPLALMKNVSCHVERMMGIFPNIKK